MLPIFTKPIDTLTAEDAEQLVAEAVPEGSTVEFKEALPHRRKPDLWETEGRISDYSRNEVLAEIVAFANSHGGQLVIGIQESDDHPKRATGLAPVANCAELADRLRHQARDCIEPQLPVLSAIGIPADDAGRGLVLIRVERSYLAPHRLIPNRECYYRRADRTERMSMREIQDLTLQTERGTEHLDAVFARHREEFRAWFGAEPDPERAGFRVTIAPVWPLHVERLQHDSDAFPRPRTYKMSVGNSELELYSIGTLLHERPIVRGWCREDGRDPGRTMQLIRTDGTGEIRLRLEARSRDDSSVYPGWLLAGIAIAISMSHAFRSAAGAPTAEYALEWELCHSKDQVILGPLWPRGWSDPIGPATIRGPFPRLSIGGPEDWNRLMQLALEDLLASAGKVAPEGPYSVDW